MKTIYKFIPIFASFFFILLFIYAAASKMLDFENFQVQLAQSPLLSAYAGFISYGVIGIEIGIAALLMFQQGRKIGLYASFAIMVAFTVYIYLILNYSDFVPCSCGGILEKMGWTEHLIFNIGCTVLAGLAMIAYPITPKAPKTDVSEEEWMSNYQQRKKARWMLAYQMTALFFTSSGLMVALFLSSDYVIKKENNFTRRFLPNYLTEAGRVDLPQKGYYFAGSTGSFIYLGNRLTPLVLSKVDWSSNEVRQSRIYADIAGYTFRNLKVKVKAPYYYLYDGTVPVIYRGAIGDSIPHMVSKNEGYFSQLAVLDSARFALRTQSSATHLFTLAVLDLAHVPKLQLFPKAIEKQIDGIFDADGILAAGQEPQAKAVYMFFYRNQFITADYRFGTLRKQKTIDHTARALIKTKELSDGKNMMTAPPFKVNNGIAVCDNLVFIVSAMRGKHEPLYIHRNRDAVDIYNTDTRQYQGSFYLPVAKAAEIFVTERYVFILAENSIFRYQRRKLPKESGEAENLSKE